MGSRRAHAADTLGSEHPWHSEKDSGEDSGKEGEAKEPPRP